MKSVRMNKATIAQYIGGRYQIDFRNIEEASRIFRKQNITPK